MLLCMPVTPVLIKHKDGKCQKLFWLISLIETECSITDSQLSVQLQHKLPRQLNFSCFSCETAFYLLSGHFSKTFSTNSFTSLLWKCPSVPAQAIYKCKLNSVLSCWSMTPVTFLKCEGKAPSMVNQPIESLWPLLHFSQGISDFISK